VISALHSLIGGASLVHETGAPSFEICVLLTQKAMVFWVVKDLASWGTWMVQW